MRGRTGEGFATLATLLIILALTSITPAHAEEYDPETRDWRTTAPHDLADFPPSQAQLQPLINHVLDADWTMPICSFKFVDVFDGTFRLVALLDSNGRHVCNRVVVVEKNGTYFHIINDWKIAAAENISDMMRDFDGDHSPELILTVPWSRPEGTHCTAIWQTIYKWDHTHFADDSRAFPSFYKARLKDLQGFSGHEPDAVCHQMEMDKIARFLGSPAAGFTHAAQWMKDLDASVRRKAAAVFADIGDDPSKKNLALLAKDADSLTAESARLYQESPRLNKE